TDAADIVVALAHPAVPPGMLITDVGTAQAALGLTDVALSRVAVKIDAPGEMLKAWGDRLLPGFSAGVDLPGWTLEGWQVRSLDAELPGLAFARSVLFNLGALGSLAMVVAWLLVYQVSVIWLRRRRLTMDRLRQMGVTDRELRAGFLLSLAGAGLVTGAAGLWIGDGLATLLARTVTGYGGDAAGYRPAIDGWLVLKGLGSAVGVSVLGGWLAYRREMTASARVDRRWVVAALFLALTGISLAGTFLSERLIMGFAAIAAAALMVLMGIRPVLSWLRGASRWIGGRLLARVGLRELVWYPGDLAVAIGALALALATSIAIALMVDSFRHDFAEMLDRRMIHDVFVAAEGRGLSQLAAELRGHPGVTRVQAYGRTERRIRGFTVEVGFTAFDEAETARYGMAGVLGAGECLVNERLARTLDVTVGDDIAFDAGRCRIAQVFAGFGDAVPRLLMGEDDARAAGIPVRYDRLSIQATSTEAAMAAVRQRDPTVSVSARGELRKRALEIFDETFAITGALTLMALIVASVGLYNALLALRLLLARSVQLLRAMGVSGAELATIERWRAIGVGAAAVLLAVPLGLVMGWLLCRVINPRAFGWSLNVLVTWPSLVWPVLSAVLAMTVVSILPTPAERSLDEA
ncbi:MAG: hypothetical protein P8Y69_09685, partial [Gammaproteobacteria bacterium]